LRGHLSLPSLDKSSSSFLPAAIIRGTKERLITIPSDVPRFYLPFVLFLETFLLDNSVSPIMNLARLAQLLVALGTCHSWSRGFLAF
jgi:hypothetical protein